MSMAPNGAGASGLRTAPGHGPPRGHILVSDPVLAGSGALVTRPRSPGGGHQAGRAGPRSSQPPSRPSGYTGTLPVQVAELPCSGLPVGHLFKAGARSRRWPSVHVERGRPRPATRRGRGAAAGPWSSRSPPGWSNPRYPSFKGIMWRPRASRSTSSRSRRSPRPSTADQVGAAARGRPRRSCRSRPAEAPRRR